MTTQAPTSQRLRTHLFKACQRRHGDLVLDREFEALGASSDYVCLQCGRRAPVRALVESTASVVRREAVAANAA